MQVLMEGRRCGARGRQGLRDDRNQNGLALRGAHHAYRHSPAITTSDLRGRKRARRSFPRRNSITAEEESDSESTGPVKAE